MSGWTVVDAITNKSQPVTGKVDSGAVAPYIMPAPGQQDPVGKMRISSPQAMIDTDFEYGQQPTKWESVSLQNNRPSVYLIPQSPLTVTGLNSSGTTTLTITGTFTVAANTPIYVQNSNDPNQNGWWWTIAGGTNTMTVITTNASASGNQFNPALTYVYTGLFYTSCGIQVGANAFTTDGTSSVTCTTTNPHGLSAGSLIYIVGTSSTGTTINGAHVVTRTIANNSFVFTNSNGAVAAAAVTNSAGITNVFARPAGYVESRTFDGGVAFSAGAVAPNSQLIRQTRRYFRYQSGKGIQFSTGTSLCPNLVILSITSSGTTATVTSRYQHNLAVGCVIRIEGCEQGPYNGNFTVATVPSPTTFTYTLSSTTTSPATGFPIRVSPVNWFGSTNRIGIFDQQNGLFFEYDGQTLYAVWRNSVTQINGTVSVTQDSASVVGTNTLFSNQLKPGDFIVIRGQSYRVTTITSDTQMYITPEYRGTTLAGALASKTVDVRVPRSQWDDPLDGTGPSGYVLDLTKMQMFYIDYSWYGAGFVRWGLRTSEGQISYVYQQTNNNRRFEAYLRSGNLPAHYESNGVTPVSNLLASLSNTTTTTSAAVSETATTIPVTSGAIFNSIGGVALIGSERILYAGVSGNNLIGCRRGFANTTPRPYANGTTVTPDSIAISDTSLYAPSGTVRITAAAISGAVEHIAYAAKTSSFLYGLTRAQTGGALTAQSFTFSATAPIPVEYAAPDTNAALSHWGSSVIMDGLFNDDKSLVFNYGTTVAVSIAAGATAPILAIRAAPSVDNGTIGVLGAKEVINRSQIQLTDMAVVSTGAVLVNLILNGRVSGFTGSFVPVSVGTQITSSLAQVAVNTSGTATIAGGESVTALYANGVQSIDLSDVRDLGNSILGGGINNTVPTTQANMYPDGPDVLYVVATNTTAGAVTVLARINWKEAQA